MLNLKDLDTDTDEDKKTSAMFVVMRVLRFVIISYAVCTKTNPGEIPSLQINARSSTPTPAFL